MSTGAPAGSRDKEAGAYRCQRHQPENTLLYQVVERYYPEFTAYLVFMLIYAVAAVLS